MKKSEKKTKKSCQLFFVGANYEADYRSIISLKIVSKKEEEISHEM